MMIRQLIRCAYVGVFIATHLVEGLVSGQLASSSGCQTCADTGSCHRAFRNGPGKYCGAWVDGFQTLPCCCPVNSICKLTQNSCRCHVEPISSPSRYSPNAPHHHGGSGLIGVLGSVLFGLLILVCCLYACSVCCSCCFPTWSSSEPTAYYSTISPNDSRPPPYAPVVAEAVPVSSYQYGSSQPPYDHGGRKRGGGLGAGALGAAGGFLAGTFLGSAFGGGRRHGDAGYDIRGDSGGGGGGYDIQGDSGGGGGGYDIQGDSG